MGKIFTALFLLMLSSASAQTVQWEDAKLNTASKALYMKKDERAMIYEINRIRSNPARYAELFIKPLYEESLSYDTTSSSGKQFTVSTTYEDNKPIRDTVYQNSMAERMKALKSLYDTLRKMKPLQILRPDEGIYKACIRHAKDQKPTGDVNHRGTDGSWPWDRITQASPGMKSGNENLACGPDNVRHIVLQLLIDSGIEHYGHRYNILNPAWTHAACYKIGKVTLECQYWIQNFGAQKKP